MSGLELGLPNKIESLMIGRTVFINPNGDKSVDGAKLRGLDGRRTEETLLKSVAANELQLGTTLASIGYSDLLTRPVQLGNALRIARASSRMNDREEIGDLQPYKEFHIPKNSEFDF
jgi:hypothetical protein